MMAIMSLTSTTTESAQSPITTICHSLKCCERDLNWCLVCLEIYCLDALLFVVHLDFHDISSFTLRRQNTFKIGFWGFKQIHIQKQNLERSWNAVSCADGVRSGEVHSRCFTQQERCWTLDLAIKTLQTEIAVFNKHILWYVCYIYIQHTISKLMNMRCR